MVEQIDPIKVAEIRALHDTIEYHRSNNTMTPEIYRMTVALDQKLTSSNLKISGGCPGEIIGDFNNPLANVTGLEKEDEMDWGDKKGRKYKKGICVVPGCPSPKPTEVGPCSVCKDCQGIYDDGKDPSKEHSGSKAA